MDENIDKVIGLIRKSVVAMPGLDLIVTPEIIFDGSSSDHTKSLVTLDGPQVKRLRDICKEIKIEIAHLYNYMKIAIQKFLDKEKFNLEYQILQVSRTRTLYLFTQIINYIDINKNYFNVFLNDLNSYPNKENDAKILLELIKENRKNFIKINQIIQKYNESLNFYVNILFRNQ